MSRYQLLAAECRKFITRRWFFRECGVGLGAIALHSLLSEQSAAAPDPMAPKRPHFAPKAKNVIYLFMAGGPSHLELYDNKPTLTKYNGKLPPPDLLKDYRAAFIRPDAKFLGPKFKFARHGKCGVWVSELLRLDAVGHRRSGILLTRRDFHWVERSFRNPLELLG